MSDFNNCSTMSIYYDDSNKLVIGKMKNQKAVVPIEKFVGLKPKMYSFLVDSENKKAKGVNRNVVAIISHHEYTDVFLNKKNLRHSMNMIQIKDYKIGTYEINKIFFVLL